jgi:hypothetical protein
VHLASRRARGELAEEGRRGRAVGGEDPVGARLAQIEAEHAGRREILGVIEAALGLALIANLPIPFGRRRERAAGQRDHRRQRGIGLKQP